MSKVRIQRALISVYDKDGLEEVVKCLVGLGVEIVSTGGTQTYLASIGVTCTAVEDLTDYPSIFGGRVKTLHPAVFGGILARRDNKEDANQAQLYGILPIDLVIVDLYPFVDTVRDGKSHEDIIEKIDIGGISLIRAAAKNYKDVVIVPSKLEYAHLLRLLKEQNGYTEEEQRKQMAMRAFEVTAAYDYAIACYFQEGAVPTAGQQALNSFAALGQTALRYGENPHQKAVFYGDISERFEYLQGKELSYNNLLDVDAAVHLIEEFPARPACAILKHNNPCGLALRDSAIDAYKAALACDPVSAFGGIIVLNREVDLELAREIDKIFFEVLIAPSYTLEALTLFAQKPKRIILKDKIGHDTTTVSYRTVLGGLLMQDRDLHKVKQGEWECVTHTAPLPEEASDLEFAQLAVKHCKSNAIVLAKGDAILGAGYGQTSRVDALKQAITQAKEMGFALEGAVMASDAFFPFPDCIELAHKKGITAVIQPGGSIRDQESINYCNEHGVAMVFTGKRHFRH